MEEAVVRRQHGVGGGHSTQQVSHLLDGGTGQLVEPARPLAEQRQRLQCGLLVHEASLALERPLEALDEAALALQRPLEAFDQACVLDAHSDQRRGLEHDRVVGAPLRGARPAEPDEADQLAPGPKASEQDVTDAIGLEGSGDLGPERRLIDAGVDRTLRRLQGRCQPRARSPGLGDEPDVLLGQAAMGPGFVGLAGVEEDQTGRGVRGPGQDLERRGRCLAARPCLTCGQRQRGERRQFGEQLPAASRRVGHERGRWLGAANVATRRGAARARGRRAFWTGPYRTTSPPCYAADHSRRGHPEVLPRIHRAPTWASRPFRTRC